MDRYRESRHIELNIPQSMYQAVLPPKLRGGGGRRGHSCTPPLSSLGKKKGIKHPKYMIIVVLSLENTYTMVKHEACLFALGRSSQPRTVFTLFSKGTDLQVRSATEVLYSSHS